jgi:hypothetical protein
MIETIATHYPLFECEFRNVYALMSMHSGPHVNWHGWHAWQGFAQFTHMWANHLAHHKGFRGNALALHSLSHKGQVWVRMHRIRKWHHHGHLYEVWGSYARRHLLWKVRIRVR